MSNTFDLTADLINVRDITARVDALEGSEDADDLTELASLMLILDDLASCGWYPVTLIDDDYFQTYAQELAEDCDMISRDVRWPHTCIDWEQVTRELQQDYSSIEIDGRTYWYR